MFLFTDQPPTHNKRPYTMAYSPTLSRRGIRETSTRPGGVRHFHRKPQPDADFRLLFDALPDGVILNDGNTGRVLEANATAAQMHGYPRATFLGLHPTTYIHADFTARFSEPLGADPSDAEYVGEETHLRRDGLPFPVEVHRQPFFHQERWCHLSVIRDISERLDAERKLRQAVILHTREQKTLLHVSRRLADTMDFPPDFLLEQLRDLIDYTYSVLFAKEGEEMVVLATHGAVPSEQTISVGTRLGDTDILATVLNAQQPLRISDIQDGKVIPPALHALFQGATAVLLEGLHALMWIPLVGKGRLMGGILATHTDNASFSDHHAELALTLANQAAITMLNTELHRQAQSMAVLEERQRLAQDLHDAINQSLFSAGLIAEVLPRLWEQDPTAARHSLADLHRLTRGAAAEMRGLLAALRPSDLADADMEELLHQLGNALMGRTDLTVTVAVTGQDTLPAPVQVMFYRLCQEALNNVAKHGAAQSVAIHLHFDTVAVVLQIQDDGRGFDPEQISYGHFGLSMMHERATSVGAILSITSRLGYGSTIEVRWERRQTEWLS
jgi:PAS domain S-box-containing protein